MVTGETRVEGDECWAARVVKGQLLSKYFPAASLKLWQQVISNLFLCLTTLNEHAGHLSLRIVGFFAVFCKGGLLSPFWSPHQVSPATATCLYSLNSWTKADDYRQTSLSYELLSDGCGSAPFKPRIMNNYLHNSHLWSGFILLILFWKWHSVNDYQ